MVDVREARYFIAVAEELHFGRAADRLHMSQPPLSQAIKAIERRLGVTLLHRTTREVALTAAGTVFLDRCRILVGAAESAGAAAQAVAEGAAGQLRIGAVTSAFRDPLPAALEHFRRHRAAVEIRVEEVDSHVGVQAVRRRELDVAFVRQLATPSDCVRARLRTERFVLAIPAAWARYPAAEGLTLAADLPWVWIPRTISPDYHDQIVACCRAAGFAPDARHTAQSHRQPTRHGRLWARRRARTRKRDSTAPGAGRAEHPPHAPAELRHHRTGCGVASRAKPFSREPPRQHTNDP
jgi:DNA-binding transcriptional LysR family regulator